MKKIIPDMPEQPVAETPIAETEATSEETTEEAPKPKTLDDGTELVYAREDSGRNLPHLGLALEPGYLYVVGEDFDGAFGQRLVETGICRLAEASTDQKQTADLAGEEAPEKATNAVSAEDEANVTKNEPSLAEMVKVEVTKEMAEHQSNDEHQP